MGKCEGKTEKKKVKLRTANTHEEEFVGRGKFQEPSLLECVAFSMGDPTTIPNAEKSQLF